MDHTIAQLQQALNDLLEHLRPLGPDTQPLWGAFTPQHMVEHISGTLLISNGRFTSPSDVPESEWTQRKQFIYSQEPFPMGVVNPRVTKGTLRFSSYYEALEKFWQAYDQYRVYWHEHPTSNLMHPMYGPLNREEWLRFHLKHMRHHLAQFGLVERLAG